MGYIGLYETATVFYGPNWEHNDKAKAFTIEILKEMQRLQNNGQNNMTFGLVYTVRLVNH